MNLAAGTKQTYATGPSPAHDRRQHFQFVLPEHGGGTLTVVNLARAPTQPYTIGAFNSSAIVNNNFQLFYPTHRGRHQTVVNLAGAQADLRHRNL